MAKSSAGPRFSKRRGRDLTVKDAEGRKHRATLEPVDQPGDQSVDEPATQDAGSFAFGYCKSCDWTGPARRARDKARKDAVTHEDECPGKGNIRIGVSRADPR